MEINFKSVIIALALLFTPFGLKAESNTTIKFGSGVHNVPTSSLYAIGFENHFKNSDFLHKIDLGFWTTQDPRNSGSIFGSFLLGHKFGSLRSFNLSILAGILIMSGPDRILSTPFQFTEEISLGYQGFAIGLKHISNASIKTPNFGRDYVFFNYTIQLLE